MGRIGGYSVPTQEDVVALDHLLQAGGGTGYAPATSNLPHSKPCGLVTGAHTPPIQPSHPWVQDMAVPSGMSEKRGNKNMTSTSDYSPETLAAMVRMRLRSEPKSYFEHWHFHKTMRAGESLVVGLIVQDGVVTVLEDSWALFPSDQLITQLRLLEK